MSNLLSTVRPRTGSGVVEAPSVRAELVEAPFFTFHGKMHEVLA